MDPRDSPCARARHLRDRPSPQAGALSRPRLDPRRAGPYPLLLALAALDATGYSVIVPVAPAIADATGAGPSAIGLLVATFPAAMVAGFALAGWVLGRVGSRALLTGSIVLVAVGAAGFALADSLGMYFAARALMGLASGGIWIGVTFETLERWPGQEYLRMSRVFAAYSLGGLVGPALGTFGGIDTPFLAYLVLLVAALPLVLLLQPAGTRREFAPDTAALRTGAFWMAAGAALFGVLALGVLEGVLPLHFGERLTQAEIGVLYVGTSIVVAVTAIVAGGRPPLPLVSAAVLLSVAGVALAGASASVPVWLVAMLLAGLGIGLANTGALGLLVEAVPVERIVTAMVVWSELGIAGYLLGPLAGGIVAERLGYAWVGLVPAVAGIALVALLLTRRRARAGA